MARWSRRNVIAAGAAGVALPLAGQVRAQTQKPAQPAPAPPLRVRANAAHLKRSDPNLVALASALRLMGNRPDSLSWENQVQIHAGNSLQDGPGVGNQHTTWRFFPWHRCQLFWFEKIVARISGKADFAMPYWDWQETGQLPPLFTDPSSPFFHQNRNPDMAAFDFIGNYQTTNGVGAPADVFQGGFTDVVGEADSGGSVETAGHAYVHIAVGGDMGFVEQAPRDPLSFFHHANIDRVWATWAPRAAARGEVWNSDWLAETFDGFIDATGGPARIMGTSELLTTEALGYKYDAEYPSPYFDERPSIPPPGKTKRVQIAATPHHFKVSMDPGVHAQLRLALPSDLIGQLAAEQDQRFKVSGMGRVRSSDSGLNGAAFDIAVERVRQDCSTEAPEPMACLIPFIGVHTHGVAAMRPMAGMTQPAPSTNAATAPVPASDATAPTQPPPTPKPPHRHGFLFRIGPEIYDTTGKPEPVIEIAVTASTRWVKPSASPTPAIDGLELDLIVTEYGWV